MIDKSIVSTTVLLLYVLLLGNLFYKGEKPKKMISANRLSEKKTKYLFYITVLVIIPFTAPLFKGLVDSYLVGFGPSEVDVIFVGTLYVLLRVAKNTFFSSRPSAPEWSKSSKK